MKLVILYSLIVLLTIATLVAIGYAIYVKIRYHRFTRERYAFACLRATISLAVLGVTSIATPPWVAFIELLRSGNPLELKPSGSLEVPLVIALIIVVASILINQIFRQWNGATSQQQHDRKKLHEDRSWVSEGTEEFVRLVRRQPPLPIYQSIDYTSLTPALEPPVDKLTWRDQARDLVTLRWPSYSFNGNEGWHEIESCWIGKNVRSNDTAGLMICYEEPSPEAITNFVQYVKKVSVSDTGDYDLRIAVQDGTGTTEHVVEEITIPQDTEDSLLEDLVDFTDYFIDIKKRVEVNKLPDSDYTLSDIYEPSKLKTESDDPIPEDLEQYLSAWLKEPGQRQLALLGDPGQGKSTGALMFTHRLIQESGGRPDYVPILMELRGKDPSGDTPLELFGSWASAYRIEPQALEKLLRAGRLLVIFEGFDEMKHVAEVEARLGHFRSLWKFCYPEAKLLFTGRPHFFLDNEELKAALGIEKSTATGAYCEALRLLSFSSEQMSKSLRWADEDVRNQIIELADQDENVRSIVSLPSHLYMVAHLWKSRELAENRNNMTSALVIDLFIKHNYKRQTAKEGDDKRFMVLTEAEREYFMDGVAAYMAARDLKNQVTREQFDDAIASLYHEIPEEVSQKSGERPLRLRLERRDDPLDAVKTDVRTYGLLVQDLSRLNALKFPHKSFFEYLFASCVSSHVQEADRVVTSAIWVATGATPDKVIDIPESLAYTGEILGQIRGFESPFFEPRAHLKYLFRLIVVEGLPAWLKPFKGSVLRLNGLTPGYGRLLSLPGIIYLLSGLLLALSMSQLGPMNGVAFFDRVVITGLFLLIMFFSVFFLVKTKHKNCRNKVLLWFLISISLGLQRKDIQMAYGKGVATGLPLLARRYGVEDLLSIFKYEGS